MDHCVTRVILESDHVDALILSDRQVREPEFLKASSQLVEPAPRKQPIQLPKESEPAPVSPPSPPAAPVSPPVAPASPPAAPASPPAAADVEEEEYDDATVPARQPPTVSLLSQGLPRRPPSDDEEEEDYQNWDGKLSHAFLFQPKCITFAF